MTESSHKLWAAICHHALVKPDEPAILHYGSSLQTACTWLQLQQEVAQLASRLHHENVSSVALYADNSAAWIIVDLACNLAEITLLPLPGFFSAQQLQHALQTVQVDVIVTDNAAHIAAFAPDGFAATEGVCGLEYLVNADRPVNQRRESHPPGVPGGTRKVTFTSGSTGTPKGVCLSAAHLEAVTTSLLDATASCDIERHLCVLPLATLLENIAGVHAPLRRGAQVIVARESVLGFNGASGFSLSAFLDVLAHCRPNSLILIPQLLEALVLSCDSGWKLPDSLRFIAVGGATVSASLLERAWSHGLPVHEGYGLSECGSVVSLNAPGARRNGSLGRPLPHNRVEIVEGEIVVHGNVFLGYAGDAASWRAADTVATYATGDLGYMDAEGYLHFIGRRKNQLVSSFGRNISPEWIEAELAAGAPIAQSIVFGDSRPYCVALIVARHPRISDAQIADSIQQVNATLPDYARIKRWTRLASPLA
ncbi:MAG: AMP-binding protein, partial [Pseudohongiellaceae bacterium]